MYKATRDKQFLYKLSASIIIFMICLCTIAVGNFNSTWAENSQNILSSDKGGTGLNYFSPSKVFTTDANKNIVFSGIDSAPVKDSLNFITSGTIFSFNARRDLTWANVLTLETNFTGGHADQVARAWGPFVVFEGPIKNTIVLEPGVNYLVGTFNAGYRPYQFIGATCSNNHVGSPGGIGRIDCGVNGSNQLRVQANQTYPIGWIDINLVFLKAG
jgi:hypothetical protein